MWPATKQSRKMNFWWVGVLLRSQPFNTNLNCDLKCDCCNCVYFAVTVTLFFWSWLYNPMKNLSFILKCVCVCSVCVYTHTRASGGMSVCLCTFTDISNMCSCCSARLVVCRPFCFFFLWNPDLPWRCPRVTLNLAFFLGNSARTKHSKLNSHSSESCKWDGGGGREFPMPSELHLRLWASAKRKKDQKRCRDETKTKEFTIKIPPFIKESPLRSDWFIRN